MSVWQTRVDGEGFVQQVEALVEGAQREEHLGVQPLDLRPLAALPEGEP